MRLPAFEERVELARGRRRAYVEATRPQDRLMDVKRELAVVDEENSEGWLRRERMKCRRARLHDHDVRRGRGYGDRVAERLRARHLEAIPRRLFPRRRHGLHGVAVPVGL